MRSKRRPFTGSKLCVIVDKNSLDAKALVRVAREAARAGADMIQFRDKTSATPAMITIAAKVRSAARRYGSLFIVNDRVDVALAVGADGVHVGGGDTDLAVARALLGPEKMIGVSAATPGQARNAKRSGADYIGAGPVFRTPFKKEKRPLGPAGLARLGLCGIPVMAIGGITCGNAGLITRCGCGSIAVIRAVSRARDPYRATLQLKALLYDEDTA